MKSAVTVGLIAIATLVVAGANWSAWRGLAAPAAVVAAATDPAWDGFSAIATGPDGNTFPAELSARAGTTVTLTGVLLPIKRLEHEGRLEGALITPPSRWGCCGLSCDSRPQLLVFVEPRDPPAAPGRQRLARVSGTLVLHAETGATATSLTGATIELLPDPQ